MFVVFEQYECEKNRICQERSPRLYSYAIQKGHGVKWLIKNSFGFRPWHFEGGSCVRKDGQTSKKFEWKAARANPVYWWIWRF